jgi:hypothetical protein
MLHAMPMREGRSEHCGLQADSEAIRAPPETPKRGVSRLGCGANVTCSRSPTVRAQSE